MSANMTLNSTTILITGGLGQIGTALTEHIQTHHPFAKVHLSDLVNPYYPQTPDEKIAFHPGSITDASLTRSILSSVKPDIVFHTAGLIPSKVGSTSDSEDAFTKVNVEGTRNVLEAARAVGTVKAFVFTSSCDVVKGHSWMDLMGVDEDFPVSKSFDSRYAESKALAEKLVLSSSSSSFPTVAIHTHAVFSSHDTNLLPLLLAAPRNIHLGTGSNLYDFTYAPNVALAHCLAAENLLSHHPSPSSALALRLTAESGAAATTTTSTAPDSPSAAGKAFFITNAQPLPFRAFLHLVWREFDGAEPPAGWAMPLRVAKSMVWLGEKVAWMTGKRPALSSDDLGDSVSERWFSNERAREVLGYVPSFTVEEGVGEAARSWRARMGTGH